MAEESGGLRPATPQDTKNNEGWAPLDGTAGIKILEWDRWSVDHSDLTITETA